MGMIIFIVIAMIVITILVLVGFVYLVMKFMPAQIDPAHRESQVVLNQSGRKNGELNNTMSNNMSNQTQNMLESIKHEDSSVKIPIHQL